MKIRTHLFFSYQTLVPPCPEVSGLPGEKFSLDLVGSSRKGGSSIYLSIQQPAIQRIYTHFNDPGITWLGPKPEH